jgi:hypothetical protein
MRIEQMAGKTASKQASMGGFETEDVLYLLPLVTLSSHAFYPYLYIKPKCAVTSTPHQPLVLSRARVIATNPSSGGTAKHHIRR